MGGSESRDKDSVTEVAGESFVRERPPDIERGTVLAGRYQIEDIIGKGGSGIVLRVFDRVAQNVVALKVLKSELARDAKWEKRFSRELRLGRPIQHPNVCRIFDIGEADGYRFLTMELASGGSLRDELKRTRALDRPLEDRLADAKVVIAGLAALHAAGVVHRDFKPDNILRMGDGRLVLSDFGLATDAANAAGATVLIGTPHYMAPEVLAGEPASTRSDVWALGVVLHEIFFGQRPERRSVSFDGSTRMPLRPKSVLERRMLALCEACMADAPFDRPSDAGAVAQMFGRDRPRQQPKGGRRLVRMTGIAVSLVAAVVGLGVWRRHRRDVEPTHTPGSHILRLSPVGEPIDWSKGAAVITEIPGRVHCFTLVGQATARLVWGTPRRVEDVDLGSGERRRADWPPEVYRFGCPDLSPDGSKLLFTAPNGAGAMEIQLSRSKDGGSPTTLTSGSDPIWLGESDGFVYTLDSSHAALFSLSTMSSTLLASPIPAEHDAVSNKAVNRAGTAVAEVLYNNKGEAFVALFRGALFEEIATFSVPVRTGVQFSNQTGDLLMTWPATAAGGSLIDLDSTGGRALNAGRYPGFDFAFVRGSQRGDVAIVSRRSRDVWLHDGRATKRLTFDGQNYTAGISPAGVLLLSKRNDSGEFAIWRQTPDGVVERVTQGPVDVEPSFSRDGKRWTYADYAHMGIMLCATDSGLCRVLRHEFVLANSPTFSPNGEQIAYLTQLNRPQLVIVSTKDGAVRGSWDAHPACAPVWSSDTTVWSLESSAGQYVWSERDLTGRRTTTHSVPSGDSLEPGEIQCSPKGAAPDSPWFQRVEIENVDTSRVLLKMASTGGARSAVEGRASIEPSTGR
jgi:Tol biopolymer transport system component